MHQTLWERDSNLFKWKATNVTNGVLGVLGLVHFSSLILCLARRWGSQQMMFLEHISVFQIWDWMVNSPVSFIQKTQREINTLATNHVIMANKVITSQVMPSYYGNGCITFKMVIVITLSIITAHTHVFLCLKISISGMKFHSVAPSPSGLACQ